MTEPLWKPSPAAISSSNISFFTKRVLGKNADYSDLHRYSLENPGEFWNAVWSYCNIEGEPGTTFVRPGKSILDWKWFPNGELNFAETMLKPNKLANPEFADAVAIVAINEHGERKALTRRQLHDDVCRFANFLLSRGIQKGDRVVAVMPNTCEAVIGMLATAAIGAIWSSCSPEFGDDAICDRFGQIEPRVLLSTWSTQYNGKRIELGDKIARVLSRLKSIESVVMTGQANESFLSTSSFDSITLHGWSDVNRHADTTPTFKRFPFQHPLCIVYSSGTTGSPKCIVHRAGGALLQHCKEHSLHCDLKRGDCLFYYTTTGWMMWNWLLSGLASEAKILLYDGNPFVPDASMLWKAADSEQVTHFGASPRYFSTLEKEQYSPSQHFELASLRCVLSTGSPLLESSFDWIYNNIKPDISLASISGGTDILSCFVLGNPCLPVHRGQIQCKGLGMDVRVFNDQGESIIDSPGELVCVNPFPSMPIGFWNDPGSVKYRAAYFARYENAWCHGDWALETAEGGFVIFGRSDATLNPSGVRIGTAEIYQQVETFPEIAECLATVLRRDGDEQIVLFVRMAPGQVLNESLINSIRQRLRSRCSPRHVPSYISAAPDLPRTISGKLSELAVRSAISSGLNIGNAGALANPGCLDFFKNWKP